MKKKIINFYLSERIKNEIHAVARREGMSLTDFIKTALLTYLTRIEARVENAKDLEIEKKS